LSYKINSPYDLYQHRTYILIKTPLKYI